MVGAAWRDPEHRKADEWMSVDIEKNHRTQISQKTQKRKVSEEPVPLQLPQHELNIIQVLIKSKTSFSQPKCLFAAYGWVPNSKIYLVTS